MAKAAKRRWRHQRRTSVGVSALSSISRAGMMARSRRHRDDGQQRAALAQQQRRK